MLLSLILVLLRNFQAVEPGKGTGRNRVIDFKPDGVGELVQQGTYRYIEHTRLHEFMIGWLNLG